MSAERDATFFDSYGWAIIRLATALPVAEKSKPPLLVFASIELVHSDRPQPDGTRLDARGIPPHTRGDGPSGMRVYFRRVALRAEDALRWYRALAIGAATVPTAANDADERGRYDGSPLRGPALVDEPPWPKLAFPMIDSSLFAGSKATYPVPFLGPGAAPARVHRLMAAADPDLEALSRDSIACDWLTSRVHFRIDEYPELLGAAVLVAPDPQVAAVKQYFVREGGKERLVTLVQPRAKQNVQGLELTVFEERFGAISTFRHASVPKNGIVVTEPPAEIRASGYMLGHHERGLIDFQPPTPFIRTVGFTMETSTRRVRLQTRDSKKKDAEVKEHEFPETTEATQSVVGDTERRLSAHERFWEAAAMRVSTDQARKADQRWIDDPSTARVFLRGLIGSARETILVADCFFNGEDLAAYLHFVRRLNVSIRVLTSRLAFDALPDPAAALRAMKASIESFHQRGIQNLSVHLMRSRGGEPILHDRFLSVDGAVWFSGNSLNAIGQRESLIIKLPDPSSVIARLNEMFETESDDFLSSANLR